MRKKKGFTLVELLVVIAIIALLMGILMPALARVRQIAFRMVCGTNLSGIGKAMLIYSNDYDDEMPRAGGRSAAWSGRISNWMADNRFLAYGVGPDGSGGVGTITSSFYLLVKYAEVTPKSFICKGDSGTTTASFHIVEGAAFVKGLEASAVAVGRGGYIGSIGQQDFAVETKIWQCALLKYKNVFFVQAVIVV